MYYEAKQVIDTEAVLVSSLVRSQNQGDDMSFDRKGGRGGFGGGRPREFHKAVCSDCKQECEVPFKPSGDRPIYCKSCFAKRKDSGQ